MNFKTKAVTLVAGSFLALSLTTGVMAQTVDSELSPNPDGACTAAISGGHTLGTFTWDHGTTDFGAAAGGTASAMSVQTTQTYYESWDCNVTVTLASLTGPNGGSLGVTLSGNPGTVTDIPTGATGKSFGVSAAVTPDDSQPVGIYSGTVTVDASSAS